MNVSGLPLKNVHMGRDCQISGIDFRFARLDLFFTRFVIH